MPRNLATLAEDQRAVEIQMLRDMVGSLSGDNEQLQESLSQVAAMFAREDRGWSKFGFEANEDGGLTLEELKDWSEQIKNSQVGNPLIKSGLSRRRAYVWQSGIKYTNIPKAVQGRSNATQTLIDLPQNQRNFFGPAARARREGALFADGLYLTIGDNHSKVLHYIPLREITADWRDPDHQEDIWAYRREWSRYDATTRLSKPQVRWYFTDTFYDRKPTVSNGKPVYYQGIDGRKEFISQNHTAFDQHANGVDGFAYGSPDALAALIWSRIVRDLFMDGVTMTSALSTFALKATASSKSTADGAVMKLGSAKGAGNTAVLGATDSLTPLSSAGKGYDFASFRPVAAVVASSLDLTVEDLMGDSQATGDKASSLPLPTRLAIEGRRDEHIAFDKRILKWMGAEDANVYFGPLLDPADLYRAQQGIAIKLATGLYEGVEIKKSFEALEGNDVTNVKIPDGFMLPNNEKSWARSDIDPKDNPAVPGGTGAGANPTQGSGNKFTKGKGANANDLHSDR